MCLGWGEPRNVGEDAAVNPATGSVIEDGNYYEIAWRKTEDTVFESVFVAWDTTTTIIGELEVGEQYDFRIRAVDSWGNYGNWSNFLRITELQDSTSPSKPSPVTVDANLVSVVVQHDLKKDSPRTESLEPDTARMVFYAGDSASFTPSRTKPSATTGSGNYRRVAESNVVGSIPLGIGVIASFTNPFDGEVYVKAVAVDHSGNESEASDSATPEIDTTPPVSYTHLTLPTKRIV